MVPARFHTLDGLRGVAALIILGVHVQHELHMHVLGRGGLAVGLFFMMSGFLTAHAYERKLLSSLSRVSFLKSRLKRLYPIYAIGVAIGAFVAIFRALGTVVEASFRSLLLMPDFSADLALFPIQLTAWSLLFEFIAIAVYAVVARHLTTLRLVTATAVGAVALATVSLTNYGIHGGWTVDTFAQGFARVGFAFPAGLLLFRLYAAGRFEKLSGSCSPIVLVATLPLVSLTPYTPWSGVTDLLYVFLLFPFVVAASAVNQPSARLASWFAPVAAISYPLYASHVPVLQGFALLDLPTAAWVPVSVCAAILVATAINRLDQALPRSLRHAKTEVSRSVSA